MFLFKAVGDFFKGVAKFAGDSFEALSENMLKDKWTTHTRLGGLFKYRKGDYKELRGIRLAYRNYLLYGEEAEYPLLFGVNEEEECPTARTEEILNCFQSRDNYKGSLKREAGFLIRSLRSLVNARFKEAKGYNDINGAAILFCAEFSQWLNEIGNLEASDALLEEIQLRIQYLSQLQKNHIFKKEPKERFAMPILLFNLRKMLEGTMVPKITGILQSRTSREYFKSLKEESEDLSHHLSSALFYLFVGEDKLPETFDIDFMQGVLLDERMEAILQTPFGALFMNLSERYHSNILSIEESYSEQHLLEGKKRKNIRYELLKDNTGGLHALFLDNPDAVEYLFDSLNGWTNLRLLTASVSQAYSLSGDGGDILLFLGLCQHTSRLLNCFEREAESLQRQIAYLIELADSCYFELLQEDNHEHPWTQHYFRSRDALDKSSQILNKCGELLSLITARMRYVQTGAYKEIFERKVKGFISMLDTIEARQGYQNQIKLVPRHEPIEIIEPDEVKMLPGGNYSPQLFSSLENSQQLVTNGNEEITYNTQNSIHVTSYSSDPSMPVRNPSESNAIDELQNSISSIINKYTQTKN